MGGTDPLGGVNLRRVHFSAKTYAKMKEIDPVGGARRRRPLDPPMAIVEKVQQYVKISPLRGLANKTNITFFMINDIRNS